VDTYKSDVAELALHAGASILNDIYAARKDPKMLGVAAQYRVPIVLMHMLGEPRTMQIEPFYTDVVKEVREFLLERAHAALEAGVPKEMIILDPGLGFGKTAIHNLILLGRLDEVMPGEFRSLMGLSRKAFLGHILSGTPPEERDLATAVASAISVIKGADIVRVHDMEYTSDAIKVADAVKKWTPRPQENPL
jgi:dihydropteroate synthase